MPNWKLEKIDDEGNGCFILDGDVLQDSSGHESHARKVKGFSGEFWGNSISKLASRSIKDFIPEFFKIDIQSADHEMSDAPWGFWKIEFWLTRKPTSRSISPHFPAWFDIEGWAMPYSIADLAASLETVLGENPQDGLRYYQVDEGLAISGVGAETDLSTSATLKESMRFLDRLSGISHKVKEKLREHHAKESLVRTFEFPDTVRSAWEQYLIYFGQFLKDLGIEADSRISEQARQVLFEVTPREGKQALSKIRGALDLYLQLPSYPDFDTTASGFTDVAVFQVQAKVMHLRSQLLLSNATLQVQDVLIATQRDRIADLEERVKSHEFAPASTPESDSEPLIPGLVSVKNFDVKFVRLHFADLLRALKRSR